MVLLFNIIYSYIKYKIQHSFKLKMFSLILLVLCFITIALASAKCNVPVRIGQYENNPDKISGIVYGKVWHADLERRSIIEACHDKMLEKIDSNICSQILYIQNFKTADVSVRNYYHCSAEIVLNENS